MSKEQKYVLTFTFFLTFNTDVVISLHIYELKGLCIMTKKIPDLSKTEWALMNICWERGKSTARQIF